MIDVYDSAGGSFIEKVNEMVDAGYESGVFALLENGELVSLKEEETRSFQKFLNKNLKENTLGDYKTICINPKDELEVKGIKVRALSPYFLINVGLRKAFGKTHKSLKNSKYFDNFPDYYKKYLNV